MTPRRFKRLRPGEQFPAADLNRLADLAARAGSAEEGGHVPPVALTNEWPRPILAVITGGTNPYSWEQLDETDTALPVLAFGASPSTPGGFGQAGSTTVLEAYEESGRADVPAGAVVRLHLSPSQRYYLFAGGPGAGPSLSVVTNVCPIFDGGGFVVGITYEWRAVTLPAGSVVSPPVCVTDATDCCDGTDSAGAATITFAATGSSSGSPATGAAATITFAAAGASAGGSGTAAGSATITFGAAAAAAGTPGVGSATITFAAAGTAAAAPGVGAATITFAASGVGGTAYTPCDDYTVDGETMNTTGTNTWGAPGTYSMTATGDGSAWNLFYLGSPVGTYGAWNGIGCVVFSGIDGHPDQEVCCV